MDTNMLFTWLFADMNLLKDGNRPIIEAKSIWEPRNQIPTNEDVAEQAARAEVLDNTERCS